jgi:predicted metal-dependent hydrolase
MFTFFYPKQKKTRLNTQRIATQHVFDRGGEKTAFTLVRSFRRKLSLQVYPDLKIVVRAPLTYTPNDATLFLQQHQTWLEETLVRMAALPQKKEKMIATGEPYLYFGKPLTIDIVDGKKSHIIIDNDTLRITQTQNTKNLSQKVILWEKGQLSTRIQPLIEKWALQMRVQHRIREVRIKKMKSRWGSCNSRGILTFNLRLMEYSESIIEYIVIHELCHLFEMNHSARFYALLTKYCPQWRTLKKAM